MRLKLIHHDYHSCEEDIVATVLASCGRSCELMYCHSWNFEYLNEQPSIGRRLYEGKNDFYENARLYYGVDFRNEGACSAKDIDILLLKRKIQIPFVLYIDDVHCPWGSNGVVVNRQHPLLITEVTNGEWYCMDPYMSVDGVRLDRTCIPATGAMVKSIVSSKMQVDIEELDRIVLQSAEDILKSQNEMAFFLCDMRKLDGLEREVSICHTKIISDLIDRFTYFARRRKQYAIFISYLAELKSIDMDYMVEALYYVSSKWQIAGKKILKIYCMNSWSNDKKRFCELLKEILDFEVEIANAFIKRG